MRGEGESGMTIALIPLTQTCARQTFAPAIPLPQGERGNACVFDQRPIFADSSSSVLDCPSPIIWVLARRLGCESEVSDNTLTLRPI